MQKDTKNVLNTGKYKIYTILYEPTLNGKRKKIKSVLIAPQVKEIKGEGMAVSIKEFNKLIKDFYNANF